MVLLFLLFLLFLLILIIVLILIINKNRTHIPENYKLMHSLFKNKKAEQNYINIDIEYEPKLTNKTIYRLWCSKDYNVNCSGRLGSNRALNITKNSNSNWKNVIYDDNDKKNFLYDIFGKDSDITKAYFRLNEVYPAARADLIRLLLLYVYGGVYLDSKSCLIKGPLPDIPDDKQMWVTNWIGSYPQNHLFDSGEYINWFIYSKKGAPILKDIINDIVDNILNFNEYDYLSKLTLNETKTKSIILSTTGPIAFTTALLKSQHKDAVEINNNIFKYLKYECNKTGIISGHYSTLKEPLIMGINMNFNNSNKIFLTYYDLNKIPKYVLDNLYLNCKGYDIELFDDNKCIIFLNKYYGETAVNIFKNFKMGAHKADFFRYCILYLFGGIYFDIKTEFIKKINDIFKFENINSFYTVIDKSEKAIYNGIIATSKYNPIIKECINHIYIKNKNIKYENYIKFFYKIVKENIFNSNIQIGENRLKNGWNCILFKEECIECNNNCDRYGLNCFIKDKNNIKLFNTRYKDYPWN